MSGHCDYCREFSLLLRNVEWTASVVLAAGYIVEAWRRDVCPDCAPKAEGSR